MRKLLRVILVMIIFTGVFQLFILGDVFAKRMFFERDESLYIENNKDNTSKINGILGINNDICKVMSQPITVLNKSEDKWVEIKQTTSSKSKIIGKVYGNLTEVKVLQVKNGYAYIEAVDYNSGKIIKGYTKQSMVKTRTPQKPYYVIVDISDQKVYVYKDDLQIKEMICSTGRENAATPIGTYLIGGRGKSFYSPKYKQGAYNWVRFNNNFLFHSVPFDSKGRIIELEKKKLGQRISHGCIRLSIEDSSWFYKTIPAGTVVIVQN